VEITWDPAKSRKNLRKHGVSFEEASELFTCQEDYLEIFDDAHSEVEDRFIAIGPIKRGLVLIVYAARDDETIRLVSARWASAPERSMFLKSMGGRHE
jgi:hypothetical protein